MNITFDTDEVTASLRENPDICQLIREVVTVAQEKAAVAEQPARGEEPGMSPGLSDGPVDRSENIGVIISNGPIFFEEVMAHPNLDEDTRGMVTQLRERLLNGGII